MLNIKNVSVSSLVKTARWARMKWGNIPISKLTKEQSNLLQKIAEEFDRRNGYYKGIWHDN